MHFSGTLLEHYSFVEYQHAGRFFDTQKDSGFIIAAKDMVSHFR